MLFAQEISASSSKKALITTCSLRKTTEACCFSQRKHLSPFEDMAFRPLDKSNQITFNFFSRRI